ncbi:unnamed protein product [Polarella glacialis]|uniref:Uncharacterized protein n=1 Tax=Polarella glacialis TaxID=89957 RepID=A0A813LYL9_POLGL|nr:unnamed protein product [Polarella glacialis]
MTGGGIACYKVFAAREAPRPSRRSAGGGLGEASPSSKPVFAFDLGAVSCFCMQTGKSDGTDFVDDRSKGSLRYPRTVDQALPETGKALPARASSGGGLSAGTVASASVVPASSDKKPSATTGRIVDDISNKVSDIFKQGRAPMKLATNASAWATSFAADNLQPFAHAVLSGCLVKAYRILASLEDPGRLVHEKTIARLRRLGDCFIDSLKGLDLPSDSDRNDWVLEVDSQTGLGFAVRVEKQTLTIISVTEQHTPDPLKDPLRMFGALCEVDLGIDLVGSDQAVTTLGQQRCDESLWHLVRPRQKEDRIMEVYSADALTEPERSLWVSWKAVAPTGDESRFGVPLPPLQRGFSRKAGERTSFRISPMWGAAAALGSRSPATAQTTSSPPSFRLTVAHHMELSKVQCMAYSITPSCLVRKRLRRRLGGFSDRLEGLLRNPDLEERMKSGARAQFYEQIRRRLASSTKPLDTAK